MDFCSEKAHLVYIERLSLRILHAHVDLALHAKERRRRRCRHAVLTGSGLCDDFLLTHTFCQQDLTDDIVDLVCTGVIQIFSFQVNLCTVFLAETLCIV